VTGDDGMTDRLPFGTWLTKSFFHGIALSLIFVGLAVGGAVLLVVLAICGAYLGVALGIILLFIVLGYLNAAVTSILWFPVAAGLKKAFFHGIALLLVCLPVTGILWVASLAVPEGAPRLAVQLFEIPAAAPVFGAIGRFVAGYWRRADESEGSSMTDALGMIPDEPPPP